jgi:two-component system, OmpR family, phosphate regulon sensor histidine kinase PhoR
MMNWLQILALALVTWGAYELCVWLYVFRQLHATTFLNQRIPGLIGTLVRRGTRRRRHFELRIQRLTKLLAAMRQLGRAVPDGWVILDANQIVRWHNPQALGLLGADTLIKNQPLSFAHPELQRWMASARIEPLVDVKSPLDPNLRLSFKLSPFVDGQRLLIIRDVSFSVKQNEVRRDFVANVSHELRTPLTVINGYLDAFEPEEFPEHFEVITQMRGQSQRMIQIVEDLLTLSRLDQTAQIIDEEVRMAPLMQQFLIEAKALSNGAHEIELVDELEMDLLGSYKDLRSAFSNLISNAIRYTPKTQPPSRIVIRWAWHVEGALFEVQDSGVGIPEQHLPRLTERFYRVSTSRSRDSGGTGLGLAIVNHVLQTHQARLSVLSEVGKGSRFQCVFPQSRMRYRHVTQTKSHNKPGLNVLPAQNEEKS